MAFCTHCGNNVNDTDKFCGSCGASVNTSAQAQPQAPQYQTQQAYYNPQPQPQNVSKKDSIMSLIFGGLSIFFGIFSMYPFFIFLVPAIICTSIAKRKRNSYVAQAGCDNGFSKAGRILSTIAIPVTIFFGIIGLIISGLFLSEMM